MGSNWVFFRFKYNLIGYRVFFVVLIGSSGLYWVLMGSSRFQ